MRFCKGWVIISLFFGRKQRISHNNRVVLVLLPVACLLATIRERENELELKPPGSKKIAHEEGYPLISIVQGF